MFHCDLMCLVDCCRRFQPPAHPYAASFIIAQILRHWTATRSLAVLTKKDLDLSVAHGPEGWRFTPVPGFLPAQLGKPRETLLDIRDVKYRRQTFMFHYRSRSSSCLRHLRTHFFFDTNTPAGVICLIVVICPFSSTNSICTSANSGKWNLR